MSGTWPPSERRLELLNSIIIGFMVGLESLLPGKTTQAVVNVVGYAVGREIMKHLTRSEGQPASLEELEDALVSSGLAESLRFELEDDGSVTVTIDGCLICPKRVGGYEFEGTACPWGGMLAYMIGQVLGKQLSAQARLTPGETCKVRLRPKRGASRGVDG